MVVPTYTKSTDVHKRLADLKFRISKKKLEAGAFFPGIIGENTPASRLHGQLETIRDVLKKQQKEGGSIDSQIIQ